MTKEQSLYQTKLIIECLPEEDYNLIPKDIIEYIDTNMQYDETIKIDYNIDLEQQNVDEKTYEMLDKILKRITVNSKQGNIENLGTIENDEIISLKNIIANLERENAKIDEAKKLILGYKEELSKLNQKCSYLEESLNSIPKFIKMIFVKDKYKRLEDGIS